MIKVDGYPNLYRDEKTGAIVNHNTSDYNRRLKSISSFEKQKNEMDRMREDIDELKDLLKTLLKKSTV
tara:strand:+ start:730 stop:933 length:204 start_codon:yes stop_codon:yes gene_type:complete